MKNNQKERILKYIARMCVEPKDMKNAYYPYCRFPLYYNGSIYFTDGYLVGVLEMSLDNEVIDDEFHTLLVTHNPDKSVILSVSPEHVPNSPKDVSIFRKYLGASCMDKECDYYSPNELERISHLFALFKCCPKIWFDGCFIYFDGWNNNIHCKVCLIGCK